MEAVTAQLDQDEAQALKDLEEALDCDSTSEAVRIAAGAGLREHGFLGKREASGIERAGYAVGMVAGLIGVIWLATTIVWPIEARLPALAAMLMSTTAFGVGRAARSATVRGWRRRVGRALRGGSA